MNKTTSRQNDNRKSLYLRLSSTALLSTSLAYKENSMGGPELRYIAIGPQRCDGEIVDQLAVDAFAEGEVSSFAIRR